MSGATAVVTKTRKERRIPLLNGLPAMPRDDVEFVVRALSHLQNEKGETIGIGSIADVVRSLGLSENRIGSTGRSKEYLRVRIALHEAKRLGMVEQDGQRWCLTMRR